MCLLYITLYILCVCAGLKPTADAFFLFMFTVMLVAYTATSMALAISADQTVVAIANIFMTIACVFMMVTNTHINRQQHKHT